jgi:hypothetical protein
VTILWLYFQEVPWPKQLSEIIFSYTFLHFAGWKATPPLPARHGINACPLIIQQQLAVACRSVARQQPKNEQKRCFFVAHAEVL